MEIEIEANASGAGSRMIQDRELEIGADSETDTEEKTLEAKSNQVFTQKHGKNKKTMRGLPTETDITNFVRHRPQNKSQARNTILIDNACLYLKEIYRSDKRGRLKSRRAAIERNTLGFTMKFIKHDRYSSKLISGLQAVLPNSG